jgi:PHP family Zn ribbon phosphoesterase
LQTQKEEFAMKNETFTQFAGAAQEFEETVLAKVLERKLDLGSESLLEYVMEKEVLEVPCRNICAKITTQLYDQINQHCNYLGISKRKFVELALVAALDRTEQIMRERGLTLEG